MTNFIKSVKTQLNFSQKKEKKDKLNKLYHVYQWACVTLMESDGLHWQAEL